MKRLLVLFSAFALTLSTAIFAAETYDEYVAAMKAGAGANGAIRKNMDSDLSAVASAAGTLKSSFEELEDYWDEKGADDAVEFSQNIVSAAEKIEAAAKAGNKDAAAAAAQGIGANCQGCHMTHREKDASGAWQIK